MKKTIKKVRKYAEGGDVPCPPGGGGKCRPMGGVRSGSYKSESYKPGKTPRVSRKEEERAEAMAATREPFERDFPGDRAPGGFGGTSEGKKGTRWDYSVKDKMKYVPKSGSLKKGGKVVKKAAVKKAKVGAKIKSKKK